jgi:hypothetical protein
MSMDGFPEKEIRTLIVDDFPETYFRRVQQWLQGLGCVFTEQDGVYRIDFPPGTTEVVCPGMSSPWTYVTEIKIPGASEPITRIQAQRLSTGQIANHLGLPKPLTQEP